MNEQAIRFVPFSSRFDRSTFDCGEAPVNSWFRTQAGQADRAGAPRTVLAVRGQEIVGFYSSVVGVMTRDEAAQAFGIGRAKYPLSAILLAQMGVDTREQGKGLGKLLLVHALTAFVEVSKLTGFEVVLVDALTNELCAFYRKMGFTSLEDHPLRLFMTTKNLRATFASAS
ncbi:GNAT family N-acetyltransferase [Leifsonia sp. C5G2]|uniref:GNAT family N-acetyltransferase n=1 Tax=Leifsonia sp. C5G2 TaxID=2735269 RepID=UPI00158589DD|nr:GNAT family N-acetyltransferase [Leifsonia sp. C5G2]NUU05040.1 GNAT family N-acetyltransferase [Leifsonia sp. C5G2]